MGSTHAADTDTDTDTGSDTDTDNNPAPDNEGPIGADRGLSPDAVRAVAPTIAGVVLSFGALVVFRINTYPTVVRGSAVVSGLNDPYYFRYWMEQLLAEANGPTDLRVLSDTSGQAFDGVRPATHAFNWWLAELTGPDLVTAWLPVASSLAVGLLLLGVGYRLTRDLRVGLAMVGMFAFIPLHAVYSGIGFLDHQVHQYFWLGLLLAGLVWLAEPLQESHAPTTGAGTDAATSTQSSGGAYLTAPATWGSAALTGVAVGVSVHIWGGSPLLIAPLFVYVVFRTPMDIRAGLSPARALLPVVAGTAVGAAIALGLHLVLNWGELFVVLMPVYVTLGSTVIIAVGELWRWGDLPPAGLLPAEGVIAAGGAWAATRLSADAIDRYTNRSDDLFGRENIAEAVSLFDPSVLTGPLLRLGLGFLIAVPVLLWVTGVVARSYEPGWLSIVVYAWILLALAVVQNRFAGQLSIVIAVFAGLGFVALLGRLGGLRPVRALPGPTPRPDAGWLESLTSRSVFAGTATGAETPTQTKTDGREDSDSGGEQSTPASPSPSPSRGAQSQSQTKPRPITRLELPTTRRAYLSLGGSLAVTGVVSATLVDGQTQETSYSTPEYQAAQVIAAHQDAVSRSYPANFVLSRWGSNRMYNYFANGESESYGFARRTYPEFLTEEAPDSWAENNLDRVGYVVISDEDADLPPGTAYHMLQERLGVAMDYRNPLSHYRLLSLGGGGGSDNWTVSAFAIVPGATITGTGTPSETVTVSRDTELTISGVSFPYRQATTVGDGGQFAVTVPYPGEYSLSGTDTQLQVSESAVVAGRSFSVD